MKLCRCCQTEKELSEFYPDKNAKDGIFSSCKECTKRRARERFKKKKDAINEQRRRYEKTDGARELRKKREKRYREKYPEKIRERSRRSERQSRARHPEKHLARRAARKRLSSAGQNICILCGKSAEHWHHYRGYSLEHRLDVIPVCRDCHRIADKLQRLQGPSS